MSANTSIEWRHHTSAKQRCVHERQSIPQQFAWVDSLGLHPIVDIRVTLGTVAGAAARHDVSGSCLPTTLHGVNVIPSVGLLAAISALAIEQFEQKFLAGFRNGGNTILPLGHKRFDRATEHRIIRIASAFRAVNARFAIPAARNRDSGKPSLALAAPLQSELAIHLSLCGTRADPRPAFSSAIKAFRITPVVARSILSKDSDSTPSATLAAPFIARFELIEVCVERHSELLRRDLDDSGVASHVHSICHI